MRIIGWAYSGYRVLTNSKKPVKTLDDLKGLVIRVPKNEIMIATYQAWGINPTPMAWPETFTGLQQGVVDGQDNPYITNSAMKFYEVQKYVTNIRYIFSLEPLIISESVFLGLKPKTQKAVLEAGHEATLFSEQYIKDTEDRIKAVAKFGEFQSLSIPKLFIAGFFPAFLIATTIEDISVKALPFAIVSVIAVFMIANFSKSLLVTGTSWLLGRL